MNKEQRRRGVGTHGRGGRFLICSRALIVGPVPYICAFPLVIVVLTNAPPQTLTITLRTTHAPPHSFFRACVSIVTEAALREMRFPGLLAVCFPVLGTSLSGTSSASLTCICGCVLWEGCVASGHIYLLCFVCALTLLCMARMNSINSWVRVPGTRCVHESPSAWGRGARRFPHVRHRRWDHARPVFR